MRAKTLDHVAYWLDDRDRIADFVTSHLGMHVIERTDKFTLVGRDALKGKLTLFDAEGPRERGAVERVGLRVGDLGAAVAGLPQTAGVRRSVLCCRVDSSGTLEAALGREALAAGAIEPWS